MVLYSVFCKSKELKFYGSVLIVYLFCAFCRRGALTFLEISLPLNLLWAGRCLWLFWCSANVLSSRLLLLTCREI